MIGWVYLYTDSTRKRRRTSRARMKAGSLYIVADSLSLRDVEGNCLP